MSDDHERRIRRLEAMLADLRSAGRPLATPEDWIAPTLLNSWVNYGGAYSGAGYYKDPWGRVWLRGLVKDGTLGANIFLLPAGYRPAGQLIAATAANGAFGYLTITTSGDVQAAGSNVWLSLENISFRAA